MFVRSLIAVLVFSIAGGAAYAQSSTFDVDNTHSSIIFGIGHMGVSYIYGRFDKVSGEFTLDGSDIAKSQFKVTIEAASVDTNDPKRDEHLRTPEFFDVAKFPTLEFVSTSVTKTDKGMELAGKMTIHGVTKEITIPLAKVGEASGPDGVLRAGFLTQFVIKRSDYDMKTALNAIGDDVAITFALEGTKRP